MRLAAGLLALGGIVRLVLAPPAQASVDLTGTYDVEVQGFLGPETGTFTFTQSGTDLTLAYVLDGSLGGPISGTFTGGTVDPGTGAFAFSFPDTGTPFPFPPCTGNGITGTASADGITITGVWVQQFFKFTPPFLGCVNAQGPFAGSRHPTCGDGVILGDEECEDGNTADGDCCSSTCRFEPSGAPCGDGNGCTTVDTCDGAGTCIGTTMLACAPCETCVAGACVGGPEPSCVVTSGRAALSLDLSAERMSASSRTGSSPGTNNAANTDYGLCVFASDGVAWTQLLSARVPAGSVCPGGPCWKTTRTRETYRNPAGTPDGIQKLGLNNYPNPSYRVRGAGPNLQTAAQLPGTMTGVRVQLRIADASHQACYATDFTNVVPRSPFRVRARR